MPPLHRHQLARPSPEGWQALLAGPWDDVARDCLRHWAGHGLPLVVARQRVPRTSADAPVSLGLSAPQRWQRRRLALELAPQHIAGFDEFPRLEAAIPAAPPAARAALQDLAARLAGLGIGARVYGSFGWQVVSGLPCTHAASDLDLWLAVADAAQADAAAAALQQYRSDSLRIDGELLFADGDAVAWREWVEWRAGRCAALLVKRLDGVSMRAAA